MSQPQYSDFSDFRPKAERRAPAPITNLPVNALSDEVDPTREIRSLIEQLQQTAKDARAQARTFEKERDELTAQLGTAATQIEQLKANEREFRAQFVEVSALLRERDGALADLDRQTRIAAETQRRLDEALRERNDAQRQRDEAMRQRDEAARRRDEATRAAQEAATHVSDAQKQVISIRQARDAAQSANLALAERFARAEDEIADLGYARELSQAAAKKAADEISDLRRQLDQMRADRDATARQVEELTQQLDAQSKKVLDLSAERSAAAQSDTEHTLALDEARAQLDRVSAERDAERLRAQEHDREMESLRSQLQELRDAQSSTGEATAELQDLQRQIDVLAADRDARAAREAEMLQETSGQQERLAAMADQLMDAQRGREEALTSLTAAQKQIEHIVRDRDALRAQNTEKAIAMDAQIAELQSQIAELEKSSLATRQQMSDQSRSQEDVREIQARFERQRVETIELGAKLDAAQREVLELTASLAEARLQVKFLMNRGTKAAAPKAAEQAPPPRTFEINLDPLVADAASGGGPAIGKVLDGDAQRSLAAMRQAFGAYSKNPSDLGQLHELHTQLSQFAENARTSGFVAVHRLSTAFAELCDELYKIPELINPSTMRTVHQTIEFLTTLSKERKLSELKDPAKAQIYAVDDDLDNCQSIAMAMETAMIRTTYAQEPAVALGELASGRFDLIFLDVNLPGMDGFQLCAHIRELAMHTTTPIVFLTGMTTMENRVQSSLSGGNDFVAKPFNLYELTVKALTLILKAQLDLE